MPVEDPNPADRSRPTTADPVPGFVDPNRPVAFPHVPRTAGSTVKHIFRVVYGTAKSRLDVHRYRDLDPTSLRTMSFVEGHKRAGFFEQTLGESWMENGLTVLRDPVSRVVSQARHIRTRRLANPMLEHLAKPLMPLDELFDAVPAFSNLQTRMLAARGVGVGDGGRDQLASAKATLDRMAFASTDSFEASMALVAERFGMWLPTFSRTNASARLGDADLRDHEFRAEAERRNTLDAELVRHAEALLAARMSSYVGQLLALSLDESPFEHDLLAGRFPVINDKLMVSRSGMLALSGWVLVGGQAADAVVVRVGDISTPVACGVHHRPLGQQSRSFDNLYAGVLGRIAVPGDAETLEILAFDRRRGRQASRRFTIGRGAVRPMLHQGSRQVARVRRRLAR